MEELPSPPSPPHKTTRKERKKMAKDIKAALKAKRKVANFIDRTERLRLNDDGHGMRKGAGDEDDIMEITDDSIQEFNTSRSGLEDEDEDGVTTAYPHMRKFSTGIYYRRLDCTSILVSIDPPRKLYFAGKCLIRVLKGIVDVYGFKYGANGNKYAAFSAKGHSSLLCVQSVSRNADKGSDEFGHPNIPREELLSMEGAVIIMEGFENDWCEGIRHVYPDGVNFIGPSMTGIGPGKTPPLSTFMEKLGFHFVDTFIRSEKHRLMDFPNYWDDIFNDLVNRFDCSNGKICPFGGKGVGKSSFVRWLTNRFLSRSGTDKVLYIDLDPGQTEFTPPGMISIHVCTEPVLGPNFTHLKDPVRAIFLGGVNVADYPVSYIKGVADLFEFCSNNSDFEGIPWILNTMGFAQGLGVDLACDIVKIFRPTCVIQLNIDNQRRSFPFLLNKDNVASHHSLFSSKASPKYREPLDDYCFLSVNSACNREAKSNNNTWGAIPKVSREMVIISYFAEKIGAAVGFTLRSVPPLRVHLDCVAVGTINSNLKRVEDIIDTMTGNLVALCEISDSCLESIEGTQKKFINNAGKYTNNCLGFGIVRAFDKKSEALYIVSAFQDPDILSRINVILAAGGVGLPVHLYAQSSNIKKQDEIPYLMSRNEGTSTLHTAGKKFFIPKRVTHSVLKNCLL